MQSAAKSSQSNPVSTWKDIDLDSMPEPDDNNPAWVDIDLEPSIEAQEAELPPVEPEFIPPPTSYGRTRRLPRRYTDFLPNSTTNLPHVMPPRPRAGKRTSKRPRLDPQQSLEPVDPVLHTLRTDPNQFGVYREYATFPAIEINENAELEEVCDSPNLATPSSSRNGSGGWKAMGMLSPDISAAKERFAPFLNATSFRLMKWFYSGSNLKSVGELDRLVKEVLLAEDFSQADLKNFSAAKELDRMDKTVAEEGPFLKENLWKKSSVFLSLPSENVQHASEASAPTLEVPNVYHRSLLETIVTALEDSSSKAFHYTPFRQFWKPSPTSPPERIISELYNSDAFYDEHIKLQSKANTTKPGEPHIENCIAALMLWSDSTHLANFGNAALWPVYLLFGNQSKYSRCRPNSFAAHHLAYIPSLPKNLQDLYIKAFNVAASKNTITHLRRELMQAIWLLLLDADFMHAYEHGIIIKCADGITRRIFPRFFTYSADYPEKVLLSTIRNLAKCPCPRCLTKKKYINALGTNVDSQRRAHVRLDTTQRQNRVEIARELIYVNGKAVKSANVERLLEENSYTPTQSAFSQRLHKFGVNFFQMFVPDFMHKFEIGVWKAVFTHLMRIFNVTGGTDLQEINKRYRRVSTFGLSTIRRFAANASAMTKLAARDFEDLLQCSMPVFEGLLPAREDKLLQDLLFTLCTWHAYAKLRLHTSSTLTGLQATTRQLGRELRQFVKDICPLYKTKELPSEEAARTRREANKVKKGQAQVPNQQLKGPLDKVLNLFTYKLHALGDYVASIWRFGTTNGYSTQLGELEHRRVKHFYARTNKNATFQRQISQHQRRERLIRAIAKRVTSNNAETARSDFANPEALSPTLPKQHHHIGTTKKARQNILQKIDQYEDDPAFKDFLPLLKEHLLARLLGHAYDGQEHEYDDIELDDLQILGFNIYQHHQFRVNYTSYDLRRCQDSINPKNSHCDIMMLAQEPQNPGDHPYAYARVIEVFHVEVKHSGPLSRSSFMHTMQVLWVRWFEVDEEYAAGWKARRLNRVSFVPWNRIGAFGFLDSTEVIRASHLIAAFAQGTTTRLMGPSIIRKGTDSDPEDPNADWKYFYVNRFVDRDMFVRYLGGGIGHMATNQYTHNLCPDYHGNLDSIDDSEIVEEGMVNEDEEEEELSDSEKDLEPAPHNEFINVAGNMETEVGGAEQGENPDEDEEILDDEEDNDFADF